MVHLSEGVYTAYHSIRVDQSLQALPVLAPKPAECLKKHFIPMCKLDSEKRNKVMASLSLAKCCCSSDTVAMNLVH